MPVLLPNPYYPAERWAAENPDTFVVPCCDASVYGPERCLCWEPIYDMTQAPAQPPAGAEDLQVNLVMCGDCAFRPGSPERADPHLFDELERLPHEGTPFWCHAGMRRPVSWQHPDGRTVPADPADYHPLQEGKFCFQADGTPAVLCAGWAWRRAQSVAS